MRNIETLLQLPVNGSYVPLPELVDRSYALGDFQALWAVEGAGHYYALSRWPGSAEPRDLLTDTLAADVPDKCLTMLHAGLGLALAERLLQGIVSQPSGQAIRTVVRRFIALCRANSRPGYVGAAPNSALVTQVTYPQQVLAIDREPRATWRCSPTFGTAWPGGYFSPTYFLPFSARRQG